MKLLPRIIAVIVMLSASSLLYAQNYSDGKAVVGCLGKTESSAEVQQLIKEYQMKEDLPHVKGGHGLSFYAPYGSVNRITFYKKDKDFGTFKGPLPYGLNFKMTMKELKEKFPDGKVENDYFIFSEEGHRVEVKFKSTAGKKILFIAVS